eukprot:7810787-Pyramimonas_sp.AAC.1
MRRGSCGNLLCTRTRGRVGGRGHKTIWWQLYSDARHEHERMQQSSYSYARKDGALACAGCLPHVTEQGVETLFFSSSWHTFSSMTSGCAASNMPVH